MASMVGYVDYEGSGSKGCKRMVKQLLDAVLLSNSLSIVQKKKKKVACMTALWEKPQRQQIMLIGF